MRIGIDLRALMDPKITGVQVYVINLLRALFKIDSKNQYILFANSFSKIEPRIKLFNYPNVSYKIYHYPNKFFNSFQKFLARPRIDKLVGGVDLFFLPHWRMFATSSTVPLVLTFHDLSFEIYPDFFTLWKRMWHRFMNYAWAARRANAIIAVSENTKQDLVNIYGVNSEKIQVIYSGVDKPDVPSLPAIPSLPAKFFLSFGTFEPRKNQQGVLAAYLAYRQKSSDPLPLVIAGASGWKVKLPGLAENLKESVLILKDVSLDEKEHLYRQAFALLSLSFYEGFGFPILEAASNAVPVIASANTSHLEIGQDFVLFVNPFRPSQVAEAMLALEQDRSYYNALQARGLRTAEKYTWERAARETLELFKKYAHRH